MQANSSTGGRIQVLVLPSGRVVLAPPSWYLKACPWTPKTASSISSRGCFTHNDFGSCYLPSSSLCSRGSSSSFGSVQSKLTFPNHSQGIIAMQRSSCAHLGPTLSSPLNPTLFQDSLCSSNGGCAGRVSVSSRSRWMRRGRRKRGRQKQERASTPLPFAFIPSHIIYPSAHH